MSIDFRALCAELLDELQYQTDWSTAEELQNRARAALAQPEPEGPTDEEARELADDLGMTRLGASSITSAACTSPAPTCNASPAPSSPAGEILIWHKLEVR